MEISAEVRELYGCFGIKPRIVGKNVGLQIEASSLTDEQAEAYLKSGELPQEVTDLLLLDKQPAKGDSLKQIFVNL